MKKALLIGVAVWLIAVGAAWAQGNQVDEPPQAPQPGQPPAEDEEQGTTFAVYFSGGKALRAYDFERLNHTLGRGGAGTFGEYVDDWHFEMVFAGTQMAFFAIAGGFWDQDAGGGEFDSTLDGWEVLARWGMALADNSRLQLYPEFGVGYAQHALTLDGNLRGLDIGDLPSRGETEIKQYGMLLEAGLRVDLYHMAPRGADAGFLMVESLTLGWQGVPWHSDWSRGSHDIGLPNDLNNMFFIRYSLGFGIGVNRAP